MVYVEEMLVASEIYSTERSFCLQIQILGLHVFARLIFFEYPFLTPGLHQI